MSAAASEPMTDSEREIALVLTRYADAARKGKSAIAKPLFHPEASVRGKLHGADVGRSAEAFLAFLDDSGPASNLKTEPPWIKVAGDAAMARLECFDWHGIRYTDLFTLIRRDGRWLIASKVFHAHADA